MCVIEIGVLGLAPVPLLGWSGYLLCVSITWAWLTGA